MACKTVIEGGRVFAIACSRGSRHRCSTPECSNYADKQCDFAVKRAGKPGTCDRYICSKGAVKAGKDLDHCPAHARLLKASP